VQFLLKRDRRRRTLRFASLESPVGRGFIASEPALEGVDSLVWIEPDGPVPDDAGASGSALASMVPPFRYLVRSDAVFEAGRYLGGGWAALAALGKIIPAVLRDRLYDLFARNRHRVASRTESCLLPTAEERARFLDTP
jgi:predicted DCC family thiol-disulfide oxidoreductase YuxK